MTHTHVLYHTIPFVEILTEYLRIQYSLHISMDVHVNEYQAGL